MYKSPEDGAAVILICILLSFRLLQDNDEMWGQR